MTAPDEGGPIRTGSDRDVDRQHGRIADTTPGLVVEAERLPDGRAITYFSVRADT